MTEWSLETGDGRATIRFPGKPLTFATGAVFDRIPKRRVRAVNVATRGAMTEIAVDIGCDCRVSASFVGARYLALDIADRDAARPAVALAPENPAAARHPRTRPRARRARRPPSPPPRSCLIQQIERAAGQGLVQLALTAPAAPPPAAPTRERAPRSRQRRPRPPAEAPADAGAIARGARGRGADRGGDGLRPRRRARDRPAGRGGGARRLPRRRGARRRRLGDPRSPGREQRAALRARLVGEFDRPDAAALRALARFYVRTGFGAEARALLAGFPEVDGLDDRALLVDLARVVDGGDAGADGPLALDLPLPRPARALAGARRRRAGLPRRGRLRRRGGGLRRAAGRPARAASGRG